MVIFLEDVAINESGYVGVHGLIELVPMHTAQLNGARLAPVIGHHKLGTPSAGGRKIVGRVWEVNSTGLVATVEFNGSEGFASHFI